MVKAVALAINTKNNKKSGVKFRRQMPTKRVINLATVGEKKTHFGLALPGIILILIAAVAFSKFLVIDRYNEVNAARSQVSELQTKLNEGYAELADFDDLAELYAHYTYSGFTSEELNRTDRTEVLNLIRNMILPYAEVNSWSVTGNQLTIEMVGDTLQQLNLIVQQLEQQDLVDFCTMYTANTDDNTRRNNNAEEFSFVKARVVAYLNSGTEVDRQ